MKSDRLLALLLLLQAAPQRTARELAARLEVSERTIYRDVDALSAAGVPVYAQRGAVGGIALTAGYRQALTQFGEDEVRALFISGASALADLGLSRELERALEKIRGGLADPQRRAAERSRARIHIDQRRWSSSDPPVERLALLHRAVWSDQKVELRYIDRKGAVTTRTLDPLGLVTKAGVWYLVAQTSSGLRSFRVDRIEHAAALPETFVRPPDFVLDEYWRESTTRFRLERPRETAIILRVAPDAMADVTSYWPFEVIDATDANVVRIFFPDIEVALHHVIAWNDAVELLEPIELRRMLVERAHAMLARYACPVCERCARVGAHRLRRSAGRGH